MTPIDIVLLRSRSTGAVITTGDPKLALIPFKTIRPNPNQSESIGINPNQSEPIGLVPINSDKFGYIPIAYDTL